VSTASTSTSCVDIHSRVTNRIVEQLEQGIRPWMQPWNAEHAAGRITRPLRHNGEPYKGINILQLWTSAGIAGYACPIWMTFQQTKEVGGRMRNHKSLAVRVCRHSIMQLMPRPIIILLLKTVPKEIPASHRFISAFIDARQVT
jgi:antirestriction protein ArdC